MEQKNMRQVWDEVNAVRAEASRSVGGIATEVVEKFMELVRADGIKAEYTRFDQPKDPFTAARVALLTLPPGELEFGMAAKITDLRVAFEVKALGDHQYFLIYGGKKGLFKDADAAAQELYSRVCEDLQSMGKAAE